MFRVEIEKGVSGLNRKDIVRMVGKKTKKPIILNRDLGSET